MGTQLRRQSVHRRPLFSWVIIAAAIVIWLAPITLLGRMPIGGDVTSFFLPIMSYYRQALLDGRIPLWNDLWGFGFPTLAESQTGVFYPPHFVLYRLFQVETAHALNIVLHHLLAGWFTYFCGRTFGLKAWGAMLSALVFAGNGFFIIHFPHQWSYTSGCWLPLAVALAWKTVSGDSNSSSESATRLGSDGDRLAPLPSSRGSRLLSALGLSAVLAIQILAGHFQIAFYTQVVVLMMGGWVTIRAMCTRWHRRNRTAARPRVSTPQSPIDEQAIGAKVRKPDLAAALWVGVLVAFAFAMAAVQVLPTVELIKIALPRGRDYEYLSGFANTPFHLVSYLLPTLFHVNPLWRPVAWDPFRTSPEECFSYIGLVPLCLACGAAWRWRREPRVRLWVLLIVITLLFSFGPYVPGFKFLCYLPGFSGFRAASRWSVTTALFLALLVGRAGDGVWAGRRLRIWFTRFAIILIVVACAAGSGQYRLFSNSSDVVPTLGWVWQWVSPGESGIRDFERRQFERQIEVGLRAPQGDLRALSGLANLGYRVTANGGLQRKFNLYTERWNLLLQELVPPLSAMVLMWLAIMLGTRRKGAMPWLVLALIVIDLGAATWFRPTDFRDRGRVVEQSAVLRFLAEHEPGSRVIDDFQNLAMLAGAAPGQSYRTVDVPSLPDELIRDLGGRGAGFPPDWDATALRLCGIRWLVRQPGARSLLSAKPVESDVVQDPVLARIIYGRGLVSELSERTTRFQIDGYNPEPSSAWFIPTDLNSGEANRLLRLGRTDLRELVTWSRHELAWRATPLQLTQRTRDSFEFDLEADSAGVTLISMLGYPGWRITLEPNDGGEAVEHDAVASACIAVPIPAAGSYQLTMQFRSRPFERGWKVTIGAIFVWIVAMLVALLVKHRSAAHRVSKVS